MSKANPPRPDGPRSDSAAGMRRRARGISDEERALMAAWKAEALRHACAVCGEERGIRGHHIVYQQWLRRAAGRLPCALIDVLWDVRNLLPVCNDCHGAHHAAEERIPLAVIPDEAWDFARFVGLEHRLQPPEYAA